MTTTLFKNHNKSESYHSLAKVLLANTDKPLHFSSLTESWTIVAPGWKGNALMKKVLTLFIHLFFVTEKVALFQVASIEAPPSRAYS